MTILLLEKKLFCWRRKLEKKNSFAREEGLSCSRRKTLLIEMTILLVGNDNLFDREDNSSARDEGLSCSKRKNSFARDEKLVWLGMTIRLIEKMNSFAREEELSCSGWKT
jgi:hypothetical protein